MPAGELGEHPGREKSSAKALWQGGTRSVKEHKAACVSGAYKGEGHERRLGVCKARGRSLDSTLSAVRSHRRGEEKNDMI